MLEITLSSQCKRDIRKSNRRGCVPAPMPIYLANEEVINRMATIKKKPTRTGTKNKPTTKPTPARNLKQSGNSGIKPLQFKVSPEMHKEFKTYAAMNGMTMLELFTDAFRFYKDKH